MWLRTWAASYRSTPPPVASRSSPRSAPTRVSPPAAMSACTSITNVSTSSIPTAAWPFSKKGKDDQQKAGGAPPAFCWSSIPFLIAQRLAGHQKCLHALPRLLSAEETEEGFAFQIENLLLRERRDGRGFTAGDDAGKLARHNGVMLADLAHQQQIFHLLLQHHARAGAGQEQHGPLPWLPRSCLAGLRQLQRVRLRVAQHEIAIDGNGVALAQETQLLRLRRAGGDGGEGDGLKHFARRREGAARLPRQLRLYIRSLAQQQFLDAAARRDQAQSYLDEAHIRFRVGAHVMAVHYHLGPATQGATGQGNYHRNRTIFEQHVRLLQGVDGRTQHLPLARLRAHQHQQHVGARREVLRLVTDDDGAELLLALLNSIAQHLDDALVDSIHLRVELDANHAVAQIDQRGGAVVAQHPVFGLRRCQRDHALWLRHRQVCARLEIEVATLTRRADIERSLPLALHALH